MRLAPLRAPLLASLLALGCACSPAPSTPRVPADADARVLAVGDAIVDDVMENEPSFVAMLRPPGARYDGLPDVSAAGRRAREARLDGLEADLARVSSPALRSPAARLAYEIAKEVLSAGRQMRVCKKDLWAVGQMTGFHVSLANLAQAQPVGTPEARKAALSRFALVPAYVDTQIANLREGLGLGYAQAAINVEQVIGQLGRMTGGKVADSPFFAPASRDPEPAFVAAFGELLEKAVVPALVRYREFLEKEYLPRARKPLGVKGNPDGAACYLASIRQATTLPLAPEQVHELGKAELARVEGEMRAITEKRFGTSDTRAVLSRFTSEPAYLHKTREEILEHAKETIARAKAAMPRAFALQPTADVVLEPIPAYQEKTSAAHYLTAALDGSRPATYRIRLYAPEKQSIVNDESVAFHETIPGHHLQINIANGRGDNPRIARFLFNSGFGEGWALYAERLADELGLFSNDESRLGMLSSAAWRAARLVVDTGLHAFGWTRQQAIDTLLAHTAMPAEQAAQEVDRYISWPGQATSYMVGYLEIAALRKEAQTRLGTRFDLRRFHDAVLRNGSLPLPVLRAEITRWIEAGGA